MNRKQQVSQFTQTIIRLMKAGKSDEEIVRAHSFAWQPRARRRLSEVRRSMARRCGNHA